MPPPFRRRPRGFLTGAQLAPVRIRRQENSVDLKPTPHRMYVLAEATATPPRVRWYPQNRIGWRVDGALCNAAVREMVGAGWLTEAGNATHRTLTITPTGEAILVQHRTEKCGDNGLHPGWICELPKDHPEPEHRQRVSGSGVNTWVHHNPEAES